MKKNTTRSKPKNPKEIGEEVANKKADSGSSTNSQTQENVPPSGLEEQSGKTQAPVHREKRFTFDHDIRSRAPVPLPAPPVAQLKQKQIMMSAMHEKSLWDVLFIPGLRRLIQQSDGDTRMAQVVYLCATDYINALFPTPDAYLLISICKKPSVLPAKESHPRNMRILLNDRMVQGIVPSDIKPYPPIPGEIPLSALQAKNVIQIYWRESTAEELAVDYCLYIYIAKRKPVKAIVASIETNLLTVTESLAREYNRGKDNAIMAGPRTVNLNDPISRQRIVLPVRGKQCRHLECFDTASFVSMNFGPAARFLCPLCAQIVLPQDLVVDQFFQDLLRFSPGDRIELLEDDKGVTVRECVRKVAPPLTVGHSATTYVSSDVPSQGGNEVNSSSDMPGPSGTRGSTGIRVRRRSRSMGGGLDLQHDFVPRRMWYDTKCAKCRDSIRLGQKGLMCADCRKTVHAECQAFITQPCGPARKRHKLTMRNVPVGHGINAPPELDHNSQH